MNEINFMLRQSNINDIPFIFDSWHKSCRKNPCMAWIPSHIYYSDYSDYIRFILNNEKISIIVSCNYSDPSSIYGWYASCKSDPDIVHYIYTKELFRRVGISRGLLFARKEFTNYSYLKITHWSLIYASRGCLYDPDLFFDENYFKWKKERNLNVRNK